MAEPTPDRAVLVAAMALNELSAADAAGAVAAGLHDSGFGNVDRCPLAPTAVGSRAAVTAALAGCAFDTRMLAARAVVIVCEHLGPDERQGGLAAEIATRARQSGVPCAAIAAHDELDRFGARILDLQLVLVAADRPGIAAAAAQLAQIL